MKLKVAHSCIPSCTAKLLPLIARLHPKGYNHCNYFRHSCSSSSCQTSAAMSSRKSLFSGDCGRLSGGLLLQASEQYQKRNFRVMPPVFMGRRSAKIATRKVQRACWKRCLEGS
jgi:hypothetical protein